LNWKLPPLSSFTVSGALHVAPLSVDVARKTSVSPLPLSSIHEQ